MQSSTEQRQDQDPLSVSISSSTNYQTKFMKEFDELTNYAYTHGHYLLDDSSFQLFQSHYNNSKTLDSTIHQFTIPSASQNQRAIQRLKNLQKYNFRQAKKTYDRLSTPHLLQQMKQEHWPNQQDSPTPMRILSPPSNRSPTPTPLISIPNPPTSILRTSTQKQKKCYKCHKSFHYRQHCPKYRCQRC